MYPISSIGRILACLCALFGTATSGMLISVLVDRYQRVYNRKKFVPEQIIAARESSDSDREKKQDFIMRKLSGMKRNSSNGPSMAVDMLALHSFASTVGKRPRKYPTSSSPVRFIISIVNNRTENTSLSLYPSPVSVALMQDLCEVIQVSGEQMHLTLIRDTTDPSPSVDC